MPTKIREFAGTILQNPEYVTVHAVASTTENVIQKVYHLNKNYKRQLLQQLSKRSNLDSIIVFVNTLDECERVYEYMKIANIKCDYISKNKTQNARQRALKAIKD